MSIECSSTAEGSKVPALITVSPGISSRASSSFPSFIRSLIRLCAETPTVKHFLSSCSRTLRSSWSPHVPTNFKLRTERGCENIQGNIIPKEDGKPIRKIHAETELPCLFDGFSLIPFLRRACNLERFETFVRASQVCREPHNGSIQR